MKIESHIKIFGSNWLYRWWIKRKFLKLLKTRPTEAIVKAFEANGFTKWESETKIVLRNGDHRLEITKAL